MKTWAFRSHQTWMDQKGIATFQFNKKKEIRNSGW